MLPMKSEDVEADRDADCDIAMTQKFAFYFTNFNPYQQYQNVLNLNSNLKDELMTTTYLLSTSISSK